jgi:hypothetical protein
MREISLEDFHIGWNSAVRGLFRIIDPWEAVGKIYVSDQNDLWRKDENLRWSQWNGQDWIVGLDDPTEERDPFTGKRIAPGVCGDPDCSCS